MRSLIAHREAAGLTQRDLAARLKRPQSFVARIEIGERNISVIEFVVFARAVGIDPVQALAELVDQLPEPLVP